MDDTAIDVTAPGEAMVRRIAIDLIDDDGNDMRRIAPSPLRDAALQANIRIHGVLQPIGVRPVGNRFAVVFGRRRLRCARALGLPRIPADIRNWTEDAIRGVQMAENMQREAPHALDVWRSVCDLVDAGATISDAAEEIGLDDRATRQMERLGRLHPAIMALAEIEMPPDRQLRVIANAPITVQEKAAKGVKAKPGQFNWHTIADRCQVQRISRAVAIFDTGAHPELWDEDLFAQPDDEGRYTTTDIERFMALQRDALEARVAQQRAEKRRVELAEFDSTRREVKLPKGYRLISTLSGTKPKRTECAFMALRADGSIADVVAEDVAAKRAAEKKRDDRAKERQAAQTAAASDAGNPDAGDVDTEDADADGADELEETPAPIEAKLPFTKAGQDLIAAAKTAALRQTLREGLSEVPMERLVTLLLLSMTAKNIDMRIPGDEMPDFSYGTHWAERQQDWRHLRDIAFRLLDPAGGLADISAADLRVHVGEALTRFLNILGPDGRDSSYRSHSGDAAEWIGAAIGAGDALPRFDTAEFLATVNGETLRQLAKDAGIKSTGAVGALRASLAGKLPDWRPDAAQFGAPAPRAPQAAA